MGGWRPRTSRRAGGLSAALRRAGRTGLLGLTAAALLGLQATGSAAQVAPSASSGTGAEVPIPTRAAGATIGGVEVTIRRPGGSAARDGAVAGAVESALAGLAGRPFDPLAIAARLKRVRARTGAAAIDWRLAEAGPPVGLIVVAEVDTVAPERPVGPVPLGGLLPPGFPTLYRSDRALVTAIVGGGFGVYSDSNPWFGDPALFNGASSIAGNLPGGQTTWTEAYLEAGLGAAAQIGDTPFYAFGAVTGMATTSLGQDVFRDDTRVYAAPEKAYAGVLFEDPEADFSALLSLGRQAYTVNDGFLVHFVRQSSNAGIRGATYLGPRVTSDFTALLETRLGPWRASAFWIDLDELPIIDTETRFAGATVGRAFDNGLALDAMVLAIADSNGSLVLPTGARVPREGVVTVAGHGRWREPSGLTGVWVEGELAHQVHETIDMAAWGGYGLVGYRAAHLPLRPSISYRFAALSGDDPDTATYERFDPLMSTGLGYWLQGLSFGKLTANSNLVTHRVQGNLEVTPRLNLTLEYFCLAAAERNNAGANPALAQLASTDLGQEVTFTTRWAATDRIFFQGIASVALPGEALEAIGADEPWVTLQASLYWTF